jgi:hypothetical protein
VFVKTWRYTPGNLFLESPISNPKSTNIGIIIGPIIGGSLTLVVIICVIVYLQCKKRHGKTTKTKERFQMMKSTHRGKWQNILYLVIDILTFFSHHMYFEHFKKNILSEGVVICTKHHPKWQFFILPNKVFIPKMYKNIMIFEW